MDWFIETIELVIARLLTFSRALTSLVPGSRCWRLSTGRCAAQGIHWFVAWITNRATLDVNCSGIAEGDCTPKQEERDNPYGVNLLNSVLCQDRRSGARVLCCHLACS